MLLNAKMLTARLKHGSACTSMFAKGGEINPKDTVQQSHLQNSSRRADCLTG
jgi:hypothetical protein